MMRKAMILAAVLPLLSGGCVARAAWDVATLPVKAGAKAVDWTTTSAKERDEKYAHQQRKAAERRAKDDRAAAKRARKNAERYGDQPIDGDLPPER